MRLRHHPAWHAHDSFEWSHLKPILVSHNLFSVLAILADCRTSHLVALKNKITVLFNLPPSVMDACRDVQLGEDVLQFHVAKSQK
jgi:hypothetical protein